MDDPLEVKRRFGQTVRAIRMERGLTQETLAFECGLNRTYIGGVERGERNISLINIHRLAEALEVEARELL